MNSTNRYLSAWWRDLDNHEARFESPENYQADLLKRAGDMLADGVIDRLQHFDMCELVRSATAHAIEEWISDYLKPNCQYQLIDADGQVIGRADGRSIYFGTDSGIYNRAIAKREATLYRVIGFGLGTTIGCIRGQTFHRIGLPPLCLHLVSYRVNGELIPA